MMLSLLFFLRQTSCKFSCSLYMRFFFIKKEKLLRCAAGPKEQPQRGNARPPQPQAFTRVHICAAWGVCKV